MLTYSQNFEDVMLERLFNEVNSGFYIDVGAWDPDINSVTRHFYNKGWRGINIEPIAARHQLFVERRPRDVNLNVAIGRRKDRRSFFECLEDTALSTLDEATKQRLLRDGFTINAYPLEVSSLTDVIIEYCDRPVDFLKIDVEGLEGEIISSLDLRRWRPRALVVEATKPGLKPSSWVPSSVDIEKFATWSEWQSTVLSFDYVFAYFDGINRFYIRAEDSALLERLQIPPGFFDNLEFPAVTALEAACRERLEVIDRSAATIAQLETACRERLEVIDRSAATIAQLETACRERQDVIDRSAALIHRLETACRERQDVIDRSAAIIRQLETACRERQDVIDRYAAIN